MKNVEPALFELLKSLAGGRVFGLRAPQNGATPFIIFQKINSERWRDINGPSGMAQASIQIDAYANEFYQAKDLALEIEAILDGFSGTVSYGNDSPQAYVKIAGISLENDVDLLDETDDPALFRTSATYLITYDQRD